LTSCRASGGKNGYCRSQRVGWVERSETHQSNRASISVGFAALNPPYGLAVNRPKNSGVGWPSGVIPNFTCI
jgi:hypothetical protein